MDAPFIDFASLSQPNWTEEEKANATLVTDFMQHLMNIHDFDYVLSNFDNSKYIQHNRGIPDGVTGLVAYVKDLVKRFPEYSYNVKHIMASGEFVNFHSHVTLKASHRGNEKMGFIINDTWRIVDGEIVEHWDAIQPLNGSMRMIALMTGGKIRNANGLF